jgi:ribosomal-protein-alanine N-acetyltransferase
MSDGYSIPETIKTARLLLRPIALADAADVFAYASDDKVTRFMSWPTHRTITDSLDFCQRRVKQALDGPAPHWGISEGPGCAIIGSIDVDKIDDEVASCEVGYVLERGHWGRGYMAEAMRRVIDVIFRHTPLNRIEARCDPANRGSQRVMEKSGMQFEGKLRDVSYFKESLHDMEVWSILRRDWQEARGR